MRKYSWYVAIIATLFATATHAESANLLSSIFQDHAVLQRDKPIAVWGQANNGDEITVALGESKIVAEAQFTALAPHLDDRGIGRDVHAMDE